MVKLLNSNIQKLEGKLIDEDKVYYLFVICYFLV